MLIHNGGDSATGASLIGPAAGVGGLSIGYGGHGKGNALL